MLAMRNENNLENNFSLLENLNGNQTDNIPFWFMRQAGRYLSEYCELRAKEGSFLNLAYNPISASEVTLQPLRRFGMSGAILFSDILVIPQALGQNLRFETGEGPKLNALDSEADIEKLDVENIDNVLSPIYETVKLCREKIKTENFDDTALIGFAGSPWTVVCYMIEGGGSKDFAKAKDWAKNKTKSFQNLMDVLVMATGHYLIQQVEAGAQALQLFDSWSGLLDEQEFEQWVIKPTQAIIEIVKAQYPDIPIIGFPRGAGEKIVFYADQLDINGLGIDYDMELAWAHENLPKNLCLQGNLNPQILLEGGDTLNQEAQKILTIAKQRPFIFNLGHGVIKETPPEHVGQLSKVIREFRC